MDGGRGTETRAGTRCHWCDASSKVFEIMANGEVGARGPTGPYRAASAVADGNEQTVSFGGLVAAWKGKRARISARWGLE